MKRRTSSVLPVFYSQARKVATAPKSNPQPAWDTDSTVAPPTPNLSKWGLPSIPPRAPILSSPKPPPNTTTNPPRSHGQPTSSSSPLGKWERVEPPHSQGDHTQASSSFRSRNDQIFSHRNQRPSAAAQSAQQSTQNKSSNPLGKWERAGIPHMQRDNAQSPPPLPPSSSFSDPFAGRGDSALTGSAATTPIGRWVRQDAHRQRQPPSQSSTGLSASRGSMLQRDEAPHQASTLRPPQHSRAVDPRDRWGTVPTTAKGSWGHDTAQVQAKAKGPQPEAKDEADEEALDADAHDLPPISDLDPERVRKLGRDKLSYKRRGSISKSISSQLPGGEVIIPAYSRTANRLQAGKGTKKKQKPKKLKVIADVFIPSTVSVGQLAKLLNVRMERLQRKMVVSGMAEESAYDHILTSEYAALLAEEFNRNPVINDEAAFDIYPRPAHPDPSTLPLRPPIVTIMGHVDHGKTTLLDTLRSTSVAKGEAGGITQHIGAFSVPVPVPESSGGYAEGQPRTITFLDTPGHAAFSAMRARGAGVTDIIVLVVAADDGVMPQTREVIELTKKDEGKVGVVVAINKVDKPAANIDNVTHALMTEGIQLESYGGETPGVAVSGLTGQGLDNLVETLSAMAEMQDLRAERDGQVHGYVLESNVRKGLGPVATVLILRGCLATSSHIIAGTCHGKVRLMNDSAGTPVQEAYPGMAVTVSGWKELPNAGDEVLTGSEADVKQAHTNRLRKAEVEATLGDIEAINTQRMQERRKEEGEEEVVQQDVSGPKELRLVIKGDVSGSVEALEGALQGIGNKYAMVKIVSTGVGDVSESDVMMAKAAEGMIVAFSVNIPRAIEGVAASNGVPLYSSTIIYRVMEEVRSRVVALLPLIIEKKVTGEANVLELFDINLKGRRTKQVAGCRVVNGLVEKSRYARVVRDGNTVHEGRLETLKQGKRDMTEIRKGSECGLGLIDFEDLQKDDLIQMYEEIEKPGVL